MHSAVALLEFFHVQLPASRELPTLTPPTPTTPNSFCLLTHFFASPPSPEGGGRVCRRVEEKRERCLLLLAPSLMHEAQVEALQREEDGGCVCVYECVSAIFDESVLLPVCLTQELSCFLVVFQPVVLYIVCVCVK